MNKLFLRRCYVLDEWFEQAVKPHVCGRAFLIRYADDFVLGFSREDDARRVMDVLPKRFGKYGLTLHPDKTRLVPFQRPPRDSDRPDSGRRTRPATFDLLGFTHYWARSRKGNWVVKRRTATSRLRRAIRTISVWCRTHRHTRMAEQHCTLTRKLRGHFAYYGITGNASALYRFRDAALRSWRKWLSRRRRRGRIPWSHFNRLKAHYPLPAVVVVHSVYRQAAKP